MGRVAEAVANCTLSLEWLRGKIVTVDVTFYTKRGRAEEVVKELFAKFFSTYTDLQVLS